ncbi:MAG: cytidine deaminase [Oscillospiraceae bacterium]|nr:cytidine deaminase [Oscillospiraceae bacterium]
MNEDIIIQLIGEAIQARENSYAPYSGYCVGAALLCSDGGIITGCNVENASYGATNCAERTAVFKAVSEGRKSFTAIAIAGGKEGAAELDYAYPCGVCRQVLREFCEPSAFIVIVCRSSTDYKIMTLEELLPCSFGPDNLK